MCVWYGLQRFTDFSIRFQKKKSGTQKPLQKMKEEKENGNPVSLLLDSNTCLKLEGKEINSLLRMANSKSGFFGAS